jgi:hypothetical protein
MTPQEHLREAERILSAVTDTGSRLQTSPRTAERLAALAMAHVETARLRFIMGDKKDPVDAITAFLERISNRPLFDRGYRQAVADIRTYVENRTWEREQ